MIDIYPIILFALTGLIWGAAVIASGRLFSRFRIRHPDHAHEIPFAFENVRHPEKVFYFFRKKNVEFLKTDPVIWALRQKVKVIYILSGIIPFGGFSVILIIALYSIYVKQ